MMGWLNEIDSERIYEVVFLFIVEFCNYVSELISRESLLFIMDGEII